MDPSRLQEIGLITGVFIKLDQGVPYYVGMLLVFASTWSFWNWVVSFKLVCPAAIELIYEPNMKRWMQVCWTLILPHVGPLGLLCPLVIGGLLLEVCTIWPYAVNFIRLQRRKVATAPDGSPGVSTPVVVVPDPGDAEAAPPPVVVQATVIGVADEDKEEHNETNESNNVISSGNDPEACAHRGWPSGHRRSWRRHGRPVGITACIIGSVPELALQMWRPGPPCGTAALCALESPTRLCYNSTDLVL
ncbi:unnamed protein product [Durusdinium trenchii]|uniref:Uncharacterized protein n=1 Tax=Durusdinium trenchii TaxID=1381693 RepID=A0ABP0NXZ8_9DINO